MAVMGRPSKLLAGEDDAPLIPHIINGGITLVYVEQQKGWALPGGKITQSRSYANRIAAELAGMLGGHKGAPRINYAATRAAKRGW